jgi:hypothetical protein
MLHVFDYNYGIPLCSYILYFLYAGGPPYLSVFFLIVVVYFFYVAISIIGELGSVVYWLRRRRSLFFSSYRFLNGARISAKISD